MQLKRYHVDSGTGMEICDYRFQHVSNKNKTHIFMWLYGEEFWLISSLLFSIFFNVFYRL